MDIIKGSKKKQVCLSLTIKKTKHIINIMKIDYQLIWTSQYSLFMKPYENTALSAGAVEYTNYTSAKG